MGCYNSLVTTHRVHDISPILPHVVADTAHIMHLAKTAVAFFMCVTHIH